jgi:hypothetical protein
MVDGVNNLQAFSHPDDLAVIAPAGMELLAI